VILNSVKHSGIMDEYLWSGQLMDVSQNGACTGI